MISSSPTGGIDNPRRLSRLLISALVLHLMLAAAFFAILGLTTLRVAAGDPCAGVSLIETLARDDPETLARIHDEAAAIPNGDALLWRIEAPQGRADIEASWLFGTMHVTDPRVLEMGEDVRAALDGATTVVVELEDIAGSEQAMLALLTDPALTLMTNGRTLADLLDEAALADVEAALAERDIPMAFMARVKPWVGFVLLSTSGCELARRARGAVVLDWKLADEAVRRGKTLKGLETLEEQVSAFAGFPVEAQARMLAETAALRSIFNDVAETMIELYLDGRIATIMPLVRAVSEARTGAGRPSDHAAFERRLIRMRNRVMARRLEPILGEGGAFVAVGALHLPGEDGLVALLRARGYRVEAVRRSVGTPSEGASGGCEGACPLAR